MNRVPLLWLFAVLYILGIAGTVELGFRINNHSGTPSVLILSTTDKISEPELLERLSDAGVYHVISESNQWVYIDDFEGPKSIPLSEYYSFIEPLDPRNDGYADSLKEIFLSDGVRRCFIPLISLYPWNSSNGLIRRLEKELADLGPSFQLAGPGSVTLPWWVTGIMLSGIVAYTGIISFSKREIMLAIPASIVFINFGVGGILCSGLIAALQITIGQFQQDLVLRFYYKDSIPLKRFFHWYKTPIVQASIILVIYFISSYVFNIQWYIALVALVVQGSTGLLYLILRLSYVSGIQHRFFLPIELISSAKKRIEPLKVLLPFTFGTLLLFFLVLFVPGSRSVESIQEALPVSLTIDQYKAHVERQSVFSLTSLYHTELKDVTYNTYTLDSKGLLSKVQPAECEDTYKDLELPPLESLLSLNYSGTMPQDIMGQGLYLVIVVFGVLVIMYRASHGTLLLVYKSGFLDKRIAA